MFDLKSNGPRSLSKTLLSRVLLYGSAAAIGCTVEPLAESIMPLWMAVKPRPSTVGSVFLDTPFEPLATWLPFMLLYVPNILILFLGGFWAGLYVRPRTWVWLSTCVLFYAAFVVFRGGGPWWYALGALLQGAVRDGFYFGSMAVIILSSPYLGARVATWLRPPPSTPGECKKCGYSLYGLPSTVCPECGTPFAPIEAQDVGEPKSDSAATNFLTWVHRPPFDLRFVQRFVWARIGLLGITVGLFYCMNWMWLRVMQRDVTVWSLRKTGYIPVMLNSEGSPGIRVGAEMYYYTAQCTYLDLLMIVAPLVWVFGAPCWRNSLRIVVAAVVILVGNLIRSWASVYFNVRGADWFYTHDLPNYMIWCLTVSITVLLALRRDLSHGLGPAASRRAGTRPGGVISAPWSEW
jgi:exosortase/archaeosortase family protein